MLESYIKEVKKHNGKKVYIYGAGKAGEILFSLLYDNDIKINGYCVTNLKGNRNEVCGLPVFQFDCLQWDAENTLFLVGVREKGEHHIAAMLSQKGAKNILDMPEDLFDYDKWEAFRKRRPILEITPIIGCTVNCKFCPQSLLLNTYFAQDRKRKRVLMLDEYKSILEKLPEDTLIEFAGFVEPFLNEDAVDMMEYTQERGYEMTLFTTLVGLTKEKLSRVLKLSFSNVVLHTPDVNNYAHIPVTSEYLELLDTIINAHNTDGSPFITSANCQSEPHPAILEETRGRLKIWCELTDRAGALDKNAENLAHAHKIGKISCSRADNLNHNVLLPDGSVVLCCNDFGMKHILGNLLTDDYRTIIHSEAMRQVKRGMKMEMESEIICRKCVYAVSDGE